MAIELHGYQYSVYSWIARLALHEKGVAYNWIEVNPFAESIPAGYLAIHPFKRVPALVHAGFVLYETGAITRYVDESFEGPRLHPEEPRGGHVEEPRGGHVAIRSCRSWTATPTGLW